MVGSEFNCMRGKQGERMRGEWGESEATPVNILNKGHSSILDATTLLLVDCDTFCQHLSTGDVDDECDMEEKRHLLLNHADISLHSN